MADRNFLAEFIQEPVYVIKEKQTNKSESYATAEKETPVAEVFAEPEIALAPPTPLLTKGENLKHCLVLVNTDAEVIGASDEEFLYRILSAVKRQAIDVMIANVSTANDDSISAFLVEQNHKHLLAFGLNQLPNQMEASLYEPLNVSGKSYLLAENLSSISQDLDKKKALWKALQSMF